MTTVINLSIYFANLLFWLVIFFWFIKKQRFSSKALIVFACIGLLIVIATIGANVYVRYEAANSPTDGFSGYISEYIFKSGVERLTTHWLASTAFALGLTLLLVWLWRAKRGLVIDAADVTLLGLGMVMVQWPTMLIMLLMVFVLVLLLQIVLVAIKKRTVQDRLIITPAIPIAVLLALLFGGYLTVVSGLSVIRF